jgi:hypothetical protein
MEPAAGDELSSSYLTHRRRDDDITDETDAIRAAVSAAQLVAESGVSANHNHSPSQIRRQQEVASHGSRRMAT